MTSFLLIFEPCNNARRRESRLLFVMLNKFCASFLVDHEINSG
ncbi:hypothetical protein [Rickettsia endosymbiont of Aspidapion aeneum]